VVVVVVVVMVVVDDQVAVYHWKTRRGLGEERSAVEGWGRAGGGSNAVGPSPTDCWRGGCGGGCIPERRRPVCGTPARSVESRRLRHNPISSSFSDSLRPEPLARRCSLSSSRPCSLIYSLAWPRLSLPLSLSFSLTLSLSLSLSLYLEALISVFVPSTLVSLSPRNTRVTARGFVSAKCVSALVRDDVSLSLLSSLSFFSLSLSLSLPLPPLFSPFPFLPRICHYCSFHFKQRYLFYLSPSLSLSLSLSLSFSRLMGSFCFSILLSHTWAYIRDSWILLCSQPWKGRGYGFLSRCAEGRRTRESERERGERGEGERVRGREGDREKKKEKNGFWEVSSDLTYNRRCAGVRRRSFGRSSIRRVSVSCRTI